jgi:hypothetical protein
MRLSELPPKPRTHPPSNNAINADKFFLKSRIRVSFLVPEIRSRLRVGGERKGRLWAISRGRNIANTTGIQAGGFFLFESPLTH